jgi:hypothetical protein
MKLKKEMIAPKNILSNETINKNASETVPDQIGNKKLRKMSHRRRRFQKEGQKGLVIR